MPFLLSQSQDAVLHLTYFRCHRLMGKATLARRAHLKKNFMVLVKLLLLGL